MSLQEGLSISKEKFQLVLQELERQLKIKIANLKQRLTDVQNKRDGKERCKELLAMKGY